VSRIVLDASAILAVINAESGHETLTPELIAEAVTSTVNLAEVQAKLVSRGWTADEVWEVTTSPVYEIVPFDASRRKSPAT
jgi:PIN domain nuclease of toxin-antitoxin system